VAKLGGVAEGQPGGIGSAARELPDGSVVGALVANNALGDIVARDGTPLVTHAGERTPPPLVNTTLVVVATDAPIDRAQAQKLAELAHDGLARAIRPSHTMFDGDVAFVLGTGPAGTAEPGRFLELADAADEAIREAVERSVRR
jgi:L-aminopeptidase/D-esterase-like protein